MNELRLCVCSLSCPACTPHVPYCHPWPVLLYSIFLHYLINATIFEKKVIEFKICILIFSAIFVGNISHSKNPARYYGRRTWFFM